MATVLAGSLVDGRPNFATLGNNGLMRVKPPTTYVSIYEGHHTTKGIREHGTFSVTTRRRIRWSSPIAVA